MSAYDDLCSFRNDNNTKIKTNKGKKIEERKKASYTSSWRGGEINYRLE